MREGWGVRRGGGSERRVVSEERGRRVEEE